MRTTWNLTSYSMIPQSQLRLVLLHYTCLSNISAFVYFTYHLIYNAVPARTFEGLANLCAYTEAAGLHHTCGPKYTAFKSMEKV